MRMTTLACKWRHPKFDYLEAGSVEEACSLLSQYGDKVKLLAGGTDLLVAMRWRKINVQYVINTKTIPNLDYIRYEGEALRIGALATLDDIESSPIIRDKFPVIVNSAHLVGTPQIRNVATIGGNLCNASPSADMAPSLIGLGARVKLRGTKGERVVTLEEFFTGPGETVLQLGEMLIEIQVPNAPPHTRSIYLKLPARTAIDLAVVGVAATVTLDPKGASISEARIVLGAVAPTPIRARQAESVLKGKAVSNELIEKSAQVAAEEAKPISDVRGSAGYRREMVRVLTKEAIRQIISTR